MMLPKKNRLTLDKEFNNIFKNGRSSYNDIIGIKAIKNNLTVVRFGIIVSNKISKKAVERNKVKRRIRSIILSEINNIRPGYDCVIITLPKIITEDFPKIKLSIINHLTRLGLRNIES